MTLKYALWIFCPQRAFATRRQSNLKKFHASVNFLLEILYTQSVLLILQRDFFIETELKLIL